MIDFTLFWTLGNGFDVTSFAAIGVIVRLLPNDGVGDVTLINWCSLNADDVPSPADDDVIVRQSTFVNDIGTAAVANDDDVVVVCFEDIVDGIDVELFVDKIDLDSFVSIDCVGSTLLFVVIIAIDFGPIALIDDGNLVIDNSSSGFLFSFGFFDDRLLQKIILN